MGRRSIGTASRRVYAGALLFLCGAADGCSVPREDPVAALDPAVVEALGPDSVRSSALRAGATYHYVWTERGPWALHLVQVDLARCELGFAVLRPAERSRGGEGRATVSGMVSESREDVLVAVNADFFTPEGSTVGAEVVDGWVTATAERPTFAWRPGSAPWLGVATRADDGLDVGWRVPGDQEAYAGGDGGSTTVGDGTEAVGGFPDLIDGGARVGDLEVAERPSFAAARHPRTAVGYDVEEERLWLVVADGRQLPHAAGMSLPELADLFELLGVDEAINLDGGGSTSMVISGRPVNRPSDLTGERAVANALALVHDPSHCAVGAR